MTTDNSRLEALGPAERIIQTLTSFTDHLVHNRPGIVRRASGPIPTWVQASWKDEEGVRKAFTHEKKGKKSTKTHVGTLQGSLVVAPNGSSFGEYREPGLFPEVAVYLYEQVASVYSIDNEFAAKWASWAFKQDRRDLKVILAAFMLAQGRKGDPVTEDGKVLFFDEDYRDVGEALILTREKGFDLNPKQVLLVGELLALPQIHEINVRLGFANSKKNPLVRRYNKAVHRWLAHRELNPKALEGLVKAGFRTTVMALARRTHYKPVSEAFYKTLRWKQAPAAHRKIGLDLTFEKDSWEGLSEAQICEKIVAERPSWKLLTAKISGLTRAIAAAAVEAGVLSDKDMIILTPTWEELDLLNTEPIASVWKRAIQKAEDQRARNIAENVKSKKAREGLEEAADVATAKAIEKVTRNMRVYFIVDRSGSMQTCLAKAVESISLFLGGFPLDRLHVSVFNTVGQEIKIQAPKRVAVEHAFKGIGAAGGTLYSAGVNVLAQYKPKPDEDALFIFVGDQEGESGLNLALNVRTSGLNPVGFLMYDVENNSGFGHTVVDAARDLGIPCAKIDHAIFQGDPYAIIQTMQNLIASTPAGAPTAVARPRVTLVEQILNTPLLQKPAWAM